MAASKPTSWFLQCRLNSHITQRDVWGLNWWSGLFPSWHRTFSSYVRLSFLVEFCFKVFSKSVGSSPHHWWSALPKIHLKRHFTSINFAENQLFQVWLAFHPYSQLIPVFCNTHGFGPPIESIFNLVMNRSLGFGSYLFDSRFIDFSTPTLFNLSSPNKYTHWPIMQKVHRHDVQHRSE